MLASVVVLVGLGLLSDHLAATAPVGWGKRSAAPAQYDGHPLVFPLWSVTAVGPEGQFEIGRVVRGVPVVGPTEGLEDGETVTVVGRFEADGAGESRGPVVVASEVSGKTGPPGAPAAHCGSPGEEAALFGA